MSQSTNPFSHMKAGLPYSEILLKSASIPDITLIANSRIFTALEVEHKTQDQLSVQLVGQQSHIREQVYFHNRRDLRTELKILDQAVNILNTGKTSIEAYASLRKMALHQLDSDYLSNDHGDKYWERVYETALEELKEGGNEYTLEYEIMNIKYNTLSLYQRKHVYGKGTEYGFEYITSRAEGADGRI